MLIPLTDTKGRTFYVNPVYVRVVQENKKGQAEVCMTWTGASWASANVAITVDRPVSDVARELNAAMPLALDLPAGLPDDDAAAAASNNAATMG